MASAQTSGGRPRAPNGTATAKASDQSTWSRVHASNGVLGLGTATTLPRRTRTVDEAGSRRPAPLLMVWTGWWISVVMANLSIRLRMED